MEVARKKLKVDGRSVGDLFVVLGVEGGDVNVDERFLRFVKERPELSFINRYTFSHFQEELRRQPQLDRHDEGTGLRATTTVTELPG